MPDRRDPSRTVVPFVTSSGVPLDGIPAWLLAKIDAFAAEHGVTRVEMIERMAEIGFQAIQAGQPLPPIGIDVAANDMGERGASEAAADVDAVVLAFDADPTPEHEATLREALRVAGVRPDEIERVVTGTRGGAS